MTEAYATVREEIQRSIVALKKADELLADKLEPLMTVKEVAEYWNCSEQHVYNVETSGFITRETVPGLVRFKRSVILGMKVDISA